MGKRKKLRLTVEEKSLLGAWASPERIHDLAKADLIRLGHSPINGSLLAKVISTGFEMFIDEYLHLGSIITEDVITEQAKTMYLQLKHDFDL